MRHAKKSVATLGGACVGLILALFLTRSAFENLSASEKWGQCEIVSSNGAWRLDAELGGVEIVPGFELTTPTCGARHGAFSGD